VELLLANKAEVNAKEKPNSWTPLHLAVYSGHRDVAELLLASKAEVIAKANQGSTPLRFAVRRGQKDMVELLRQHGGTE
jgi:ankyrin repeat protein